jgi:hypothetical protein
MQALLLIAKSTGFFVSQVIGFFNGHLVYLVCTTIQAPAIAAMVGISGT